MWFDGSLAGLSIWITYCVQVVFAYLTTLCICSFIQNPRARVRMWGCFLFLTIAAWLLLWVPSRAADPVHSVLSSTSLPPTSNLHLALPVKTVWASYVAKLAPAAWRVYALVLLVLLLHLLLKSMQLRSVLRRTEQPSPHLELLFRTLCLQWGIRHSELGLVSELRSPATCYWLRSHVLLPTELIPHLDSDQLTDVLRHELTHVRQHDYLWDRLAAVGCRLVFFHPLVWLAYRRLRWERELACDHAVVEKREESRLTYAECLTRLARWFAEESSRSGGIGFSSSESLLAVRVRALLREPSSYSNLGKAARVALVAITTTAALFLVPGLGLILYSPAPLATWLRPARDLHDDSMKTPRRKAQRASLDKGVTTQPASMVPQSERPQAVDLLLNSQLTSMPVLTNSSTVAESPAETRSVYSDVTNDDARLRPSTTVWDEAPMTLARPPKWRNLVVRAITSGVAVAAGGIDIDDIDGPRKRGR
jgi:beta-lactamase regulating signal transducer with metallopeptidase domain